MGAEQPWSRPVRPHRPLRAGLMVVGVGVGLCFVGVAGLGAWNVQVVTQASGPVRETADEFLRSVTAGDTDGAYERLCADTRTRWSQLGFTSWVRTPPTVETYEILDVSVATRGGRAHGTVTVRLVRGSGMTEQRELTVVKEAGRWRVCGDPY
ncbi:DUF4878 domain-containing protein [Micromonospora sp. WMMA1363]|uniref:Rv0361 family membrane protein n=1 Tax=Micromonospora sp. WMMA1363 TaxID=3053985 RepID=UPI00259CA4C4|nr:DUF4878 domain-containing protein [Micromonospora sp. WMMA1363]MDM4719164.1 DUF4878 domain-containing protein [Micromonospora sp. WMMA1363]